MVSSPSGRGYGLGQDDPKVLYVPRLTMQNSCRLKPSFNILPSPERGREEAGEMGGREGKRKKGEKEGGNEEECGSGRERGTHRGEQKQRKEPIMSRGA